MVQTGFRALGVVVFAGVAGLALAVAPAAAVVPATESVSAAAATFIPPTNLRVRSLNATSVVFEWDHAQVAKRGCTLWGSPVAALSNLRTDTTYTLQVRDRDNCSGRLTALSEPLVVTTAAA